MYSLSPSTHIGKTDIQKNIVKEIAIREPGKMSSKLIPLTRDYYRQNFNREVEIYGKIKRKNKTTLSNGNVEHTKCSVHGSQKNTSTLKEEGDLKWK